MPAKLLKELAAWTVRRKDAPNYNPLGRVCLVNGYAYASDSCRMARVKLDTHMFDRDGGAPAFVDPEVFERMSPKDKSVEISADAVRIGKVSIPLDFEGAGRYPERAARPFEGNAPKAGALAVNADHLAGVARLAKADEGIPELRHAGMLRASINGKFHVECLVMPVRL